MRGPQQRKVKRTQRFPKGVAYRGSVRHDGRQLWVPKSYAKVVEWEEAAHKVIAEYDKAKANGSIGRRDMTVGEFFGYTVREDRVVMRDDRNEAWPWTHTRRGKLAKEDSKRRYRESIRAFIRDYEDARLDSFDPQEVAKIERKYKRHTLDAMRRGFHDAIADKLLDENPFKGLGQERRSRLDDPNFRIITDEEFETLLAASRTTRSEEDDYRHVLNGLVLAMGQTMGRPGELFALKWEHVDLANQTMRLAWTIDSYGVRTRAKHNADRHAPISDELLEVMGRMPRISEFVFPAPRGGQLKSSNFDRLWGPIRSKAGMPDLKLYELKHRAITKAVMPTTMGGFGIETVTAAVIAGHNDGGKTIARHYLKIDKTQAAQDAVRAMKKAKDGE